MKLKDYKFSNGDTWVKRLSKVRKDYDHVKNVIFDRDGLIYHYQMGLNKSSNDTMIKLNINDFVYDVSYGRIKLAINEITDDLKKNFNKSYNMVGSMSAIKDNLWNVDIEMDLPNEVVETYASTLEAVEKSIYLGKLKAIISSVKAYPTVESLEKKIEKEEVVDNKELDKDKDKVLENVQNIMSESHQMLDAKKERDFSEIEDKLKSKEKSTNIVMIATSIVIIVALIVFFKFRK